MYRIPMDTGVAGYVARTGRLLNIGNVRESVFFNPEVDEMTGYSTNTLLCAPITVGGRLED